jgi:hypothetical protein
LQVNRVNSIKLGATPVFYATGVGAMLNVAVQF